MPNYFWKRCVNEDGWRDASDPNTSLGFRPDLDREHIEAKVNALMLDLHDQTFIYISNGTEGEIVANRVVRRCREKGRFDQISILHWIIVEAYDIEIWYDSRHGQFWQDRAVEWLGDRGLLTDAASQAD